MTDRSELSELLDRALEARARGWLESARARVVADPGRIDVVFAAIARSAGRRRLGGGMRRFGDRIVDLDAWRVCDAAGLELILRAAPDDARLEDLYQHGDYEERTIVMRSLALLDVRPATVRLLGEAQRTNTQAHFEACVCDSNLLARAVGKHGFRREDAYKMLLKGAFVGLPLARFFELLERHASVELSRMVAALASERAAAGRPVWRDTERVIAAAPIEGTVRD